MRKIYIPLYPNYIMTSIRKKVIKGHSYYYLVETAWVNGKSKTVWQMYIGTAEKIKGFYTKGRVLNIHSKLFGSVAGMLSIAEELRLKETITNIVPDINYKLKIWEHVLLQSICRFHEPQSKNKSIDWYNKSILPILWKKTFSSPQTILNQFDKIVKATEDNIPKIEEEICKTLIEKGIKPSVLIWDPTNFFTYIEEGENLPQKGHSKEKRYDKNIINLGLVVGEENIPLMHTVYEGNKHESKVVTGVVDGIYARLKKLGQDAKELVFVFDKGNNSTDNILHIDKKFHFIGALKKNQLKDLFDIGLEKFEDLYPTKSENIVKGYRTTKTLYGEEYVIVVTYNEKTAEKQKLKTEESIRKIKKKFEEIEAALKNKKRGKKTTIKGVARQVNKFLHNQYQSLFSWELDEQNQKLTWKLNEEALIERQKTNGKSILFTDLNDWTSEKITKTYNSKTIVEDDFKLLKNRLLIPVKPIFHQKDSHLRVHIFICVLSMLMYRYMLWKLKDLNMSEQKIIEELKNMRLAFVKEKDSNVVKNMMETMTSGQIKIYSALNLDKYHLN